jgi:hypothetical protein
MSEAGGINADAIDERTISRPAAAGIAVAQQL